jgi:DNA polymerase
MSSIECEIDFETKSEVDIRQEGAYRYAVHKSTRVLMASYSFDGGQTIKRWNPKDPCPDDIAEHIFNGGTIVAHNANFERLIIAYVCVPRHGWPQPDIQQFRCTAATAAALALPRDLGTLGTVLDLPVQKNEDGKALIKKFSQPRNFIAKDRKFWGADMPEMTVWNEPEDHPEDWEKFWNYCDDDVRTEAGARKVMQKLRTRCQEIYWLNEKINDRGIRIDLVSAKAALLLVDRAKARLDRELREVTRGAVASCSQVEKLKEWLTDEWGVDVASLGKADIEDLLEMGNNALPDAPRRAIELRRDYAKASTSKLKAFLARAGADGRIRGAISFRGAGTGRYTSVGAQVHNLPRPRKEFGDAHLDAAVSFWAMRHASPELLDLFYGHPLGSALNFISDNMRGFIWAGPGNELLAADYSGIEGAIQAWFAGEDWKVKALFDLIADPSLPDMYRRAAAGIFNTTTDLLTKKDVRRQIGKVSELSLGYQGGVNAFLSMAKNYLLKLGPIYQPAWDAATPEVRERASKRYEECVKRGEKLTKLLTREEWIGAEIVKVGWRATHPAIVKAWKLLEDAAKEAVMFPGRAVPCLKVSFIVRRGFLWCLLPSGRCLAYGAPAIREVVVPWADMEVELEARERRPAVTFLGVNQQTRQFRREALYGGLIFENVVQAIALDLLDNGLLIAEEAGYNPIFHVHDEIVCEVPQGFGDLAWFERAICELPDWAAGLPLTASGFRGKRYRKD